MSEHETTTWEYKVWSSGLRNALNDERFERELNDLGREGWELVDRKGEQAIFKRPRVGGD